MSSPSLAAANRRGIAFMCLTMAFFVLNDAMVKFVSQSLPAAQLIFVRGCFACALVLAFVVGAGQLRQLPRIASPRVAVRATLDALATMGYLTSLFHLPIANATAINMAAPLFITVFAVLLLRERVGVGRWVAIGAGFVGVLLIVQPASDGFNAFALLCVAATFLHATRDFITRFIAADIPSLVITLSTVASVTLLSGAITAFEGWRPMQAWQLGVLATASASLSLGYYLLVGAMRGGEVSVIAPFRYVGLLFALVLGFVVWRDVPNGVAFCGIGLLLGAGLFVLHGERARARMALEAAAD